jgi:hypothetical protein
MKLSQPVLEFFGEGRGYLKVIIFLVKDGTPFPNM